MLSGLELAAYNAGAAGWEQLCRDQQKRIAELESALRTAYAAMSVAQTIDAVRAEYDFEPAIRHAAAVLPRN